MKTIATLIFVLFVGVNLQAQIASDQVKVVGVEMTISTESSAPSSVEAANAESAIEVARLYKRNNTRIKKELTFSTKANRAKMA